jgi:Pentapeptide repeats (8 copies)
MNEVFPGAGVIDRIEATFTEMARDVNHASSSARNAWMFFMALLAYFFIALAGITHRDLLLATPVKLPLLEVDIGLRAFYLFGPLILLLIHFGILLQHAMLARKVLELHGGVARFEGPSNFRQHRVRIQLNSYFYTQLIAGPYRSRMFAGFLSLMTWGTLVLLPTLLLLDFQVGFLPFHDLTVTWAHRVYLVIDLALIAILGIYMRHPGKSFVSGFGANMARRPLSFLISTVIFLAAIFFAFAVATVPDEAMDKTMAAIPQTRTAAPVGDAAGQKGRPVFWPTAMLFDGAVDLVSGHVTSPFARNLVVTDADLVRDSEVTPGESTINLRRRDLRYGTFDRSDLHQADLTGAILVRASLRETNLSDVKAEKATFQDADLWRAQFIAESSSGRPVRGADLRDADFRRANLREANLQGAQMTGAFLAEAELANAQMDPEDQEDARQQGARF